jgi:hypothetical protein
LKGKQEASGYPSYIKTEEDKDNYINNYYLKEGIKLDKNNIKDNPGMRNVMKMFLNSQWGRLGMRQNKTKYQIINNAREWYDLIHNDEFEIKSIDITNENILQVFYKIKKDQNEGSNEISVPLACFVTCHARLKLFRELVKIDRRVLYYDTDSIIFISCSGKYEPELGDFLGEFTDELQKKKSFIIEFISAGPKNYAYRLQNGETSCTVKGFSLNSIASVKINFDSIKDLVCNDRTKKIHVDQIVFKTTKYNWDKSTIKEQKKYGLVYTKRRIINFFNTLPFGYIIDSN